MTSSSIVSPMLFQAHRTAPRSASNRASSAGHAAQLREETRLHHLLDGEGGLLLAGEVAEEGALGDLHRFDDLVDGGLLVPLCGEKIEGGVQQGVPGASLLPFTQSGRIRGPLLIGHLTGLLSPALSSSAYL